MFRYTDRSRARTAAAVRRAEGFVRVVVHAIGAEVARPDDSQDGVHVRAVQIQLGALGVDNFRDVGNLSVKHTNRVGVGDHQCRRVVIDVGPEVVQIDTSVRERANGLKATATGGAACRIRAG